ncbi:TPA: hypothetical protein ACH3X3_004108 [Trebouxia sp. C0006]
MHPRWMADFEDANWDLAIIYSGNQTQYACPQCVHLEVNKGAKWLLVYGFTQSTAWQNEYQHRYSMVYVPDDDILQTTATINRVFNIHAQHGLLLSQPVLCSWLESHTASWDMVKGPTTVLRYTNFVEIMVPLFSMSVFNSTVISTMSHAETGWGLDWLWPFLLGCPSEKIAIIDEVCVIHPKAQLQPPTKASMYAKGHSPGAEECGQYARFGYDADAARDYGMPMRVAKRLGQLWQPWYEDMLQQAGLQVDSSYIPVEREVKLMVNTSLHLQHVQQSQAAMLQAPPAVLRTNLVVVTGHPTWLPANANATWDLVIIQHPSAVSPSPACLLTFTSSAVGRYQQLWQLMQSEEWKELHTEQYQYIYLPDSDVYHAAEQIDRMFEMMAQYDLLMAHPSVCSDLESDSHLMDMLKRQPTNVLRYTTAVDILAPLFDMAFFQDSVVNTLHNATYGHGLQWLWPFLIGYAPRRIAVLDEVCIVHPRDDLQAALRSSLQLQSRKQSLALKPKPRWRSFLAQTKQSWTGSEKLPHRAQYSAEALSTAPGGDYLPMRAPGGREAQQEIEIQLKYFGYKAELYGVKHRSADLVETVFQPWYQDMLDMGSIQVSAIPSWHHLAVRKPEGGVHLSTSASHPFSDLSVLQQS